ncbi:MAG: YebC/PmpR family DNA-binding transcriptional regulator [Trueperaceae bacterium]|nr:YebC/PmpR family DNA-binding transcriptional regulator [Trueperaceae bacterium]
MAGHNKWSQIKRKKAANDAQRGKIISKHIRAIQSAIREGSSDDPSTNLSLKNALAAAKSDSVPSETIDRAIERATGGGEGASYDAVTYEGYGPAGVAFVVEALTDNRNRTVSEVRHVFTKHGGNMSGGTAWQFESAGIIVLPTTSEKAQEMAIELGAQDLEIEDESLTIYTDPAELYAVVDGLQAAGFEAEMSQLTKLAQTPSLLSAEDAAKVLRFTEALEDLDDVQNVYSTADLSKLEAVG